MSGRWTLDDIDWDRFDPSVVTDDALRIVKATTTGAGSRTPIRRAFMRCTATATSRAARR
jgi:hypothetical protein